MMETYTEMKARHGKEINNFPIGWAFSEDQLREQLQKLGLDPDTGREDVVGIGGGGFIRKADQEAFHEMIKRHNDEWQAAVDADKTGTGFILEMFKTELADHEYSYTGDTEETLDALGISEADLENNPALLHGLQMACGCGDPEPEPEPEAPQDQLGPAAFTIDLKLKNWNIEEQTGYKPITTFYTDFSIADHFGPDAVRDTYQRAFQEWHTDYKYITELVLALNWKIWEHYKDNEPLARVYDELYHTCNSWAWDNLTGDEQQYFYRWTD